jgi:hypothetical protein
VGYAGNMMDMGSSSQQLFTSDPQNGRREAWKAGKSSAENSPRASKEIWLRRWWTWFFSVKFCRTCGWWNFMHPVYGIWSKIG